MRMQDDIKPITYLKNHAAEVLQHIESTHRHMIITQNGEAKAVLQDAKSFENMRSAIVLMKLILQSKQAVTEGKVVENERVFSQLERKLKKKL